MNSTPVFRARATAACLVTAPALVLAAHLAQATPTQHDTASELASIAAHPDRYQASAALGFVAVLLYVPALLGLAAPLRAERPRLALTGLSMSVSGLLALASLMGSGPVSLAMADASADRAAMIALTDRYESGVLVGVWGLLMVLGWSLGPIVLGFGLWRSGFSPAVPALLVAGLVLQVLDAGRWPLALGFACTTAALALVAVRTWASAPVPEAAGEPQGLAV